MAEVRGLCIYQYMCKTFVEYYNASISGNGPDINTRGATPVGFKGGEPGMTEVLLKVSKKSRVNRRSPRTSKRIPVHRRPD